MTRRPAPPRGDDDDRTMILAQADLAIALTVDASPGAVEAIRRAVAEAAGALGGRLLMDDAGLRRRADPGRCDLTDPMSRRMWRAVRPFAGTCPIAPIVARDGAVAEDLLAVATAAAAADRVIVRVGGTVAVHLTAGFGFRAGLPVGVADPAGQAEIRATDMARGLGCALGDQRRPAFGIADSVWVTAQTAAKADAAAAVLADAVDVAGHPAITRVPADLLEPGSPYGARPVVRAVGRLSDEDVDAALGVGVEAAQDMIRAGHITGALLLLRGRSALVGQIADAGQADAMPARASARRP
jgi:ApbE superfamily uncharacterized protein (UPF0280 family)